MSFSERVKALEVQPGTVCVTWIGQAGFLLKMSDGKIILIDPYLTDSVYRLFEKAEGLAFKRLSPPMFEPDEIEADYLLISHEHGDHLDLEALPALLKNGRTQCYANQACMDEIKKAGIPAGQIHCIQKNKIYDLDGCRLATLDCDHGDLSPEALGFLLDLTFTRVYYSGDTSYNTERLRGAVDAKPEIALLPINGAFGNLDAREAAKLASDLQAKVCIPHHFWTFPKHMGNPMEALKTFPEYAPDCRLEMVTPGELLIF